MNSFVIKVVNDVIVINFKFNDVVRFKCFLF